MGCDAANAIYNVSYEADKINKGESNYHENFKKWVLRFQQEDLVAAGAQTDVKGDRIKRPADQADPDMYVHVVELVVNYTFQKHLFLMNYLLSPQEH